MKKKKIIRILLYFFTTVLVLLIGLICYYYYWRDYRFVPSENKFTERVGFIDPENSLLSENFETCEDYIFDYYNGALDRTKYIKGKNGLRKFVLSKYKNRDYTDSGYLNIRFVVNCKGESGRYIIHENTLNLEPYKFSEDLKNQLFELTVQLKEWKPLILKDEPKDSYMYISYRIVNGEIVEIIP